MIKTGSEKVGDKKFVYCNRCKGDTRHECLLNKSRKEDTFFDEDDEHPAFFTERWSYIVWQCLGCDSLTLEERYTFDGQLDSEGEYLWDVTFHPSRVRNQIRPKYFNRLPGNLSNIYKESIATFNASARVLCAAGLRSLIEGICVNKEIRGKNLEEKIDGLSTILPANIVKNLHSLRFMGNIATHELAPPPTDDLRLAVEICEDLLNYLYELDYKTSRLGERTTVRLHSKDEAHLK
jgi:hypothetical protein